MKGTGMDSEIDEWERQLEKIVMAHLEPIDPAESLDHAADLTKRGLNSLETVRLLVDIEEHFDIEIPAQDLTPSAFTSFAQISAMVEQTLAAR